MPLFHFCGSISRYDDADDGSAERRYQYDSTEAGDEPHQLLRRCGGYSVRSMYGAAYGRRQAILPLFT